MRFLDIVGLDRRRPDWARLADRLDRRPRPVDPALRAEAQALHRRLARFLQASDLWMLRQTGLADDDLPPGTEWHWRPRLLCGQISPQVAVSPATGHPLGEDAALWHDCPNRALILRQSPRPRPGQAACYALQIEMMGKSCGFLSLALDLPRDALAGLGSDRVLRLDSVMDAERPITIYARINLVQGPNTETMLRQLGDPVQGTGARRCAEFDLAYADLANRPVERAWLDLIFEAPHLNAVGISDLLVSHRARAQV
ncbi:DUF6478 family protein [uncultured Paracoccus sp.]|uniref:DUF6478 family protein n=1 Tax=uncultured Paracoccus sp. TaxID=189685 RepID=UPI0025E87139|nr:DUF6478 family protein [uncultured Paracoccus sp.]